MAGDNNPKPSSKRHPHPPSDRKSRWESSSSSTPSTTTTKPPSTDSKPPTTNPPSTTTRPPSDKPTPKRNPIPNPNLNPSPSPSSLGPPPPQPLSSSLGPPPPLPPPSYGFHMLDRRNIFLADGSVRSYFALPPDYQDFTPPPRPPPLGRLGPPSELMGPNSMSMKRKFEMDRDADEFARQKQHVLQYANAGANFGTGTSSPGAAFRRDDEFRVSKFTRVCPGGGGGFDGPGLRQEVRVDPAVMKAFLHFIKLINENPALKKNYIENGKNGNLQCPACPRFDR